ncbi:uncharacterized protein LOC110412063 [Herrania umbratica]|uniref:Uncharacterized protein LOC110412063 n=1 Tax=Herrania umbratica TaxID=108875 RepID=A0A6J0ZTV8_9ROSI|nr:uncharacterized protein LOC110412063 [Herrania umbratica]
MKSIHRALFAAFALLLFHLLICSPLSLHCWSNTHSRVRNQPRRLLGSFASISANLNKLSRAIQDPKKAVETSLRKAPPSASNPTQNSETLCRNCKMFVGNMIHEADNVNTTTRVTFQITIMLLKVLLGRE